MRWTLVLIGYAMDLNRMLLTLACRGLHYRWLKATGRPARIEALSIEITTRCIAKCLMCNIWRMPVTIPELTAHDWLGLLASPIMAELKELDITGGEPFLRNDIVELLRGIGNLKGSSLRRLCSVAITTNGFLTKKVLTDVGAVIGALEEAGVTLVFACGMDAVGEVHDRIRNVEEGWQKLHATIDGLKALRQRHPSLVLGIKTTVTRHNIDELEKVSRYAEEQGLFTIISPYILTSNRYANMEKEDTLSLSGPELEKLKAFYGTSRFRWSYYRDELLRYLESGRMAKPCSAGFNYYFVRSTGEMFPCPIISAPLGNVRERSLQELVDSAPAARFRRRVGELPECATCTEPGLERYALPCEGFHYLQLFRKLGRKEFASLHQHMGLEKYFR